VSHVATPRFHVSGGKPLLPLDQHGKVPHEATFVRLPKISTGAYDALLLNFALGGVGVKGVNKETRRIDLRWSSRFLAPEDFALSIVYFTPDPADQTVEHFFVVGYWDSGDKEKLSTDITSARLATGAAFLAHMNDCASTEAYFTSLSSPCHDALAAMFTSGMPEPSPTGFSVLHNKARNRLTTDVPRG
jgi:hypothetical protein